MSAARVEAEEPSDKVDAVEIASAHWESTAPHDGGRSAMAALKARLGDPYEFIRSYVTLDERGRGHCPFHPPDRHPSFAVNRAHGHWVCFHEVNPRTGRYMGGDVIEFYGASSDNTTAGEYDVQVTVSGGAITSAQIKLSDESTYRDMTITGNVITGISTFDSNGDPDYAENGLQLSVALGTDGTFNATVRVKQGFAGKIGDEIDRMLKTTTGSLILDQQQAADEIEELDEKIELEEYRLTKREERLILKFARLEATLALLQNQLAAAGVLSSSVFGGR